MPSIALIGEGVYDIEGLDPLIRRVNGADLQVYGRPCGGPVLQRSGKDLCSPPPISGRLLFG
jgi:hypothetical protein